MTVRERPVVLVASREISERTHSRTFLISTLAIIAVFVGGVLVSGVLDKKKTYHVGVTGPTPPSLTATLKRTVEAEESKLDLRRYSSVPAGEQALRSGKTSVLIVGGRRLVWKSDPQVGLGAIVAAAIQRVAITQRVEALGLSRAQRARLFASSAPPARQIEPSRSDRETRQAVALIVAALLLAVIVWYGSAVAQGVAQEKGDRVMEVLLSRVTARELLAGKVIGIGLVGLAQLLLALSAAGVAMVALRSLDVPSSVPETLVAGVVFFAFGYALWSVAYATVGAFVSRAEDLQGAIAPLNWLLIACYWVAFLATGSADAWYTKIASIVPITAPFVMPVRIAVGHVASWEIALALIAMAAATYGLIRAAAAVYSGALLRKAERPRIEDVWRALQRG